MGTTKESTCNELRQAEPFHTSVLQERHHPQARRVSETGLPVCSPSMRLQAKWEEKTEDDEMGTRKITKTNCVTMHLNT